jgi:hypothetical protein
MDGSLNESSQHCHDSPRDQYTSNPNSRAELVQQQAAGYFKNKITAKKYSCEKAKLLASNSQLLVHRQSCKANVDPVEEGDHHQNENERDHPSLELLDGRRLNFGWKQCGTGGHIHLVSE